MADAFNTAVVFVTPVAPVVVTVGGIGVVKLSIEPNEVLTEFWPIAQK